MDTRSHTRAHTHTHTRTHTVLSVLHFYSLSPLLFLSLTNKNCKGDCYYCFLYIQFLLSISLLYNLLSVFVFPKYAKIQYSTVHKSKGEKKIPNKMHISQKMMMEQLCENSLACPFPAYQVTSWHYKCHPCHQPQSLPPSPKLKVACSSSGSGRNTFAHTCALFIFNRCRVEGPV